MKTIRIPRLLGQQNPNAATDTQAFQSPGDADLLITGYSICNRSAVATSFRIWIDNSGGTDNKQYLYYDKPIGANDTIVLTDVQIPVPRNAKVNVRATVATLAFNFFGYENR